MDQLARWAQQTVTQQDALVLEMTTNSYSVYDTLRSYAHSVTVVHPPQVRLIVEVPVKTDKKAALTLAQLHAVGLLRGIWVPPLEVRELRALLAHRQKMVRLSTIAKNRLQAVLHRHRQEPPAGNLFGDEQQAFWAALALRPLERHCLEADRATLVFAQEQIQADEACLKALAAQEPRLPLLAQIEGLGWLSGLTALAALGAIQRFPTAGQLVGYAGLGTRVHDSGETHLHGKVTKAGRRDLRRAMVDAANHAIAAPGYWQTEFERLQPRLGRPKAIVAIARKLLVAVWHVLSQEVPERHASPARIAHRLYAFTRQVQVRNLPEHRSAASFTRQQLDRLQIGQSLAAIQVAGRTVHLPPSPPTK